MKRQTVIVAGLIIFSFLLLTSEQCRAGQKSWACANDDETNGVYRICNYFPLDPNNEWLYTTGEYFITDDTRKCSSGYSGILYDTTTYEFSPYMQNGSRGLLFTGCQYDEGVLEDMHTVIPLIPPSMKIGETVKASLKKVENNATMAVTLVGLEEIIVPAGSYTSLKIEIAVQDAGDCSYKTTLWLAKGIGPVKIHRTEANPADCLGCMFVCDPDNDLVKLNTPAELVSSYIDPDQAPDLTGIWTTISPSCKNSKKGTICKINGKLDIKNIGMKNAASSTVKFYLSDDDIFDDKDVYLKEISIKNIAAGSNFSKSLKYTLQNGEVLTGKYCFAVIDANNTMVEADEGNNLSAYGPIQ